MSDRVGEGISRKQSCTSQNWLLIAHLFFFFLGGGGRIKSVRYTKSQSTDSSRNVSLNILTYFLAKINGEERIFHSKKGKQILQHALGKLKLLNFCKLNYLPQNNKKTVKRNGRHTSVLGKTPSS